MEYEHAGSWISGVFASGWLRWLPLTTLQAGLIVARLEDAGVTGDLEEVVSAAEVSGILEQLGGLDGDPWADDASEVEHATDQAERELLAVRFRRKKEAVSRLGEIRSIRELFMAMAICGLVERRQDEAGNIQWRLSETSRLPSEIFSLTDHEVSAEDHIRWTDVFYGTSQRIVKCFVDDGLNSMNVTLAELGEIVSCTAEDARHAVATLVAEGDFTIDQNISEISADDSFVLSVDWGLFNSSRIGIVLGSEQDPDRG